MLYRNVLALLLGFVVSVGAVHAQDAAHVAADVSTEKWTYDTAFDYEAEHPGLGYSEGYRSLDGYATAYV